MSARALLGEYLYHLGLLTQTQLQQALTVQSTKGARIGTNLVELRFVPLADIAYALALQHGRAYASLTNLQSVKAETLSSVPRHLCAQFRVFPLGVERPYGKPGTIHLAMHDPSDTEAISALSAELGLRIQSYVIPELRLFYALEQRYGIPRPERFARIIFHDGPTDPKRYTEEAIAERRQRLGLNDKSPSGAKTTSHPSHAGTQTGTAEDEPELSLIYLDEVDHSKPPFGSNPAISMAPLKTAPNPVPSPTKPVQVAVEAKPTPTKKTISPAIKVENTSPAASRPSQEIATIVDERPEEDDVPHRGMTLPEPEDRPDDHPKDRPDEAEDDFDIDFDDESEEAPSLAEQQQAHFPTIRTIDELRASLLKATSRELVNQLLIQPILPETQLTVLLQAKSDTASALCAHGTSASWEQIKKLLVPLSIPSLLKEAIDTNTVVRGKGQDDVLQTTISQFLNTTSPTEAIVSPIALKGRVVALICTQTANPTGFPEGAEEQFKELITAGVDAYANLIQHQKKKK